jgi:hypothetical protein
MEMPKCTLTHHNNKGKKEWLVQFSPSMNERLETTYLSAQGISGIFILITLISI